VILAAIPYLVMQLDRGIRRALGGFGGVSLLIVVLLGAAAVPPAIEASQQQPLHQSVDDLRDGISALSRWVRMSGEITTLTAPDLVAAGQQVQSLLVEESGDAILLLSDEPVDSLTEITGRVQDSANMDSTARSVGGDRFPQGDIEVIDRYNIRVDDPIVPAASRSWVFVWAALATAMVLFVAQRVGYPVVRLRRDAGAGPARPLAVDEEIDVRAIEPQEELGPSLVAPWGRFRRVLQQRDTDPYFELRIPGHERPIHFRRHRWSRATPGTLWTIRERMPVVHLHDWGLEIVLGLRSEADRDRLLASFAVGEATASEEQGAERPAND
jgi:hypothetical protein